MGLFNLFNRAPSPQPSAKPAPECCALYINGCLYMRSPSGISFTTPAGEVIEADCDVVAPNGTTIQNIAYALALAEGAISMTPVRGYSAGNGMN